MLYRGELYWGEFYRGDKKSRRGDAIFGIPSGLLLYSGRMCRGDTNVSGVHPGFIRAQTCDDIRVR